MRIRPLAAGAVLAAMLGACAERDATTAPAVPTFRVEDAGHNVTQHFRGSAAIEFEFQNPCNGESITFAGVTDSSLAVVGPMLEEGIAPVHVKFHALTRATGTGQLSGGGYALHDVFHTNFESPSPPATQVNFSAHGRTRVTSNISGLGFTLRGGFHFVGLPKGGFKITRDFDEATCES